MMVVGMDFKEHKVLASGLLILAKLVDFILGAMGKKRLMPTVSALPVIGGLLRFMKSSIPMIREEYAKLGAVFTVNILNRKLTFFIGPEVYQFNVPTFGPGVILDVDYSVRRGNSVLHRGAPSDQTEKLR